MSSRPRVVLEIISNETDVVELSLQRSIIAMAISIINRWL